MTKTVGYNPEVFKGYYTISPKDWSRIEALVTPGSTEQPNRREVNSILKTYEITKDKPEWLQKTGESAAAMLWQKTIIIRGRK